MKLPAVSASFAEPEQSSQGYWRALYYFNLYRLVLGAGLASVAFAGAKFANLGERDPELFLWTSVAFAVVSVINLVTITRGWPPFRQQAYLQFAVDAVAINLLALASGGISSGLNLLLLVSVAAAGVVLSGRMTVFFAALSTTLAFIEHFIARSLYGYVEGSVVQIGLLGVGLFSIGLILFFVSRRIRRTEALAEKQREALVDMARLNELVVARLQTGVIVVDQQGDVELANKTAKDLAGEMREDAAVTLASWHPELVAAYQKWLADPAAVVDTRLQPDGPNIRIRFQPLSAEQRSDVVMFLEDLSATEAQAQQIKLAALGRLTAAVAHEIRNPLGAISHAGQLMRESTHLDRGEQRLVEIINKQSERINHVVKSILQLGRPAATQMVSIDLGPWLTEFKQQFLSDHDGKNDRIELNATKVRACADPDELQLVLRNLCDNALRYGRIGNQPVRIQLNAGWLNGNKQQAYLDVIDQGPGISAEDRDRIFEPFFTTDADGTGLGLFLSRELCQKNHGRLEHRPAIEQGSCFRVVFAPHSHCAGTNTQ